MSVFYDVLESEEGDILTRKATLKRKCEEVARAASVCHCPLVASMHVYALLEFEAVSVGVFAVQMEDQDYRIACNLLTRVQENWVDFLVLSVDALVRDRTTARQLAAAQTYSIAEWVIRKFWQEFAKL